MTRSFPDTSASLPAGRFGLRDALLALGAVTALRLLALAFYGLDLYPDEAQYWSWSRDFAFGYFSKPPMVAWAIGAATAACGQGEACIKAWVPLAYFVSSLFVYGAAKRLYSARVGFFAALAFITLPGISFSSFIASTDPLLILFWAMALYAVTRIADGATGGLGWWAVLGIAIGGGLLSKYAMAFLPLGLALWLAFDPEARARCAISGLRGWTGPLLALALGALIYLPNLIWNIQSAFVTFAHTGSNANLRGDLFHPARLGSFLASQFGVFGPILFATLLVAATRIGRWCADWRTRLLASLVLPMLLAISVIALLSRANANWIAPVYVAGSIWTTAVLLDGGRRVLAVASLALHLVVAALIGILAVSRDGPGSHAGIALPRGTDLFAHHDGWRELGAEISAIRARLPGVPLLADDRMVLAELLYYVRPMPEDVFAWRPTARIGHHYDLTRPLPDRPGGDYLLVVLHEDPWGITRHFSQASPLARIDVRPGTRQALGVSVIHARGFFGYKAARTPTPSQPSETRKGQTDR